MADYCNTCDPELGGLSGTCELGWRTRVLCECCGPTNVDDKGNCMSIVCTCSADRCVHAEPNRHKDRKFCECGDGAPPHWPAECHKNPEPKGGA